LDLGVRCILPYSHALTSFPDHIQQLDMESNGKRVNSSGEILPYNSGEVIMGGVGTNSQHSFFQLLHQGRCDVQCEFVGYAQSPVSPRIVDIEVDLDPHDQLMSHFFAQMDAMAVGRKESELEEMNEHPTLIPHKVL